MPATISFRRFAAYFAICTVALVILLYPTSLPQAQWALRNGYVQALDRQAKAVSDKDAEIKRLKSELEKATKAPAPSPAPVAGGK